MKKINKIIFALILLAGLIAVFVQNNGETFPEVKIVEEETSTGKIITVSAPDELNYENVPARTQLSKETPEEVIHLYQITDGEKQEVRVQKYDTNNNGLIDQIEWTVPHLSKQTYELVIVITQAEHLDENKKFISDIYKEVYKLDNVWSEKISNEEYIRVTFKQRLTKDRDITIYPRVVSGDPRIEVYEVNSEDKIAEFTNLRNNEYNKVYLSSLTKSQDKFDLRIVEGVVEIDQIIDPTLVRYYLIGGHKTGGGANGTLKTTTGAAIATWTTTLDAQTYTWIKQYTDATTIEASTITAGFWCRWTGSQGGARVEVDDIYVYDCGTSSDCTTQDAIICSTTAASVNCESATNVYREISCTPSAPVALGANDYLGVRLVADINDAKTPDLIFSFNSTKANSADSYVNITETVVSDTCTYGGSGNWALNCADNCVFAATQTIASFNNVTITGTGTLTFNSGGKWSFTGSKQYVTVASGCTLNVNTGGGWNY